MMRRTLFIFFCLVIGLNLKAQFMPTGNLTIFSEDGNKFFLILNGERQNDVAQTNIRLEELPQPYYNCKIIFENPALKEISKNMLMVADANGVMQDVTYKIKKDKSGKQILRFFSFMPVQQNMVRPNNCAVYRYGNPGILISGPGYGGGMSQGNNGNGSVGIQINSGGVNMNVQVEDPNYQNGNYNGRQRPQEVTNHYYDQNANVAQGCFNAYPMQNRDFDAARNTLKNEGFDETRLDLAKQIASTNCLNTTQISTICQLFSFEGSKLEFAKYAYDHCTDPRNYFKVSNIFSFSSSKTELNNYIQGR